MADDAGHDPFDVNTIRELVRLMSRHDINEMLLERENARIRLRRGLTATAAPTSVAILPAAPAAVAPSAPAAPVSSPAPPAKKLHEIKSPMVGTFYAREKPEAEPYVKVGTRLTPTTVVGLIEAMKLFNEVQAECNGTIMEICVENASPVDYNTVLFRVDTAG